MMNPTSIGQFLHFIGAYWAAQQLEAREYRRAFDAFTGWLEASRDRMEVPAYVALLGVSQWLWEMQMNGAIQRQREIQKVFTPQTSAGMEAALRASLERGK